MIWGIFYCFVEEYGDFINVLSFDIGEEIFGEF